MISEEKMYAMSSGYEYDAETMSADMLEDNHDSSQSHPRINRRDSCYKICYHIKKGQAEWKWAL